MTQEQLQFLRAIPIEDLASRLGLDVRHHKALCPFHNDRHPSLSFNVRKNTYRCFVCDAHGDTIDLVRHLLNKDFQQACLYLSDGSIEPIPAHSTHSPHRPLPLREVLRPPLPQPRSPPFPLRPAPPRPTRHPLVPPHLLARPPRHPLAPNTLLRPLRPPHRHPEPQPHAWWRAAF